MSIQEGPFQNITGVRRGHPLFVVTRHSPSSHNYDVREWRISVIDSATGYGYPNGPVSRQVAAQFAGGWRPAIVRKVEAVGNFAVLDVRIRGDGYADSLYGLMVMDHRLNVVSQYFWNVGDSLSGSRVGLVGSSGGGNRLVWLIAINSLDRGIYRIDVNTRTGQLTRVARRDWVNRGLFPEDMDLSKTPLDDPLREGFFEMPPATMNTLTRLPDGGLLDVQRMRVHDTDGNEVFNGYTFNTYSSTFNYIGKKLVRLLPGSRELVEKPRVDGFGMVRVRSYGNYDLVFNNNGFGNYDMEAVRIPNLNPGFQSGIAYVNDASSGGRYIPGFRTIDFFTGNTLAYTGTIIEDSSMDWYTSSKSIIKVQTPTGLVGVGTVFQSHGPWVGTTSIVTVGLNGYRPSSGVAHQGFRGASIVLIGAAATASSAVQLGYIAYN